MGLRRVLGTDPRKLPQQPTYHTQMSPLIRKTLVNNGNYDKTFSVSLDVRQSKATTTTTTTERTDRTTIDQRAVLRYSSSCNRVVDGLARDGCGTGERGSSRDYLSGAQQALRYHIWRSDTPQLAKDTPIAGPVTRRHVRCSCQSHDPDDSLTYHTDEQHPRHSLTTTDKGEID